MLRIALLFDDLHAEQLVGRSFERFRQRLNQTRRGIVRLSLVVGDRPAGNADPLAAGGGCLFINVSLFVDDNNSSEGEGLWGLVQCTLNCAEYPANCRIVDSQKIGDFLKGISEIENCSSYRYSL